MIFVDAAADPAFAPGTTYVRADLLPNVAPTPRWVAQSVVSVDDLRCCGERPETTYGLGAPCGGFALWAICFACEQVVWFRPSAGVSL